MRAVRDKGHHMDENNPNVKRHISPAFRVSSIAILTAVTAVFTLIIRIPIAPTRGYINLGDVAIYFTAFTLGPVTAMIAGGLGTALADVLAGYPQWALISFFIHGIQGFAVGTIMRRTRGQGPSIALPVARVLFAGTVGTLIMAGFYYLAGAAMSGFAAAAVEIPGNIIQNAAGLFAGVLLTRTVSKAYPPIQEMYW